MTKLLDFWAVWCVDPQTPVLTENGYIPASDILIGQRVITVDPETKERALKEVRKVRVFKDVPSIKIVLETGRTLIGDENHLVLTTDGFKKLKELAKGQKILVDPSNEMEALDLTDDRTILTTTGNSYADDFLKKVNLLPLKASDPKLPILARLLGFVMTDGYLYEDLKHNIYETHFFVGTDQDALSIKNDLQVLGFDRLEIKKQVKERVFGERKAIMNISRCRNLNRSLFFLLKALGSPIGRKKNQAYFVPEWILSSNIGIKREFMSGWIGGDGCKIDYYLQYSGASSHNAGFQVNCIEFHKVKELEREGVLYAKQLGLLFEELGVEVAKIFSIDDEDGVIISLKVATNYPSLLNLAKISYAYSTTKNCKIPFIREFIRYRLYERSRYNDIKQAALQQLSSGMSNASIAANMQVPVGTVISWKYSNSNSKTVHPPCGGQAVFNTWLEERQQGDLLWQKVNKVEEVEPRDVIGVTVDDPHTIITDGIVSHNCGPCKVMEPILEEIEKELPGKFEIEKINVDEQSDLASQYGVMSIPTYIVIKDGKEVGRKIGITSKADLVKLING